MTNNTDDGRDIQLVRSGCHQWILLYTCSAAAEMRRQSIYSDVISFASNGYSRGRGLGRLVPPFRSDSMAAIDALFTRVNAAAEQQENKRVTDSFRETDGRGRGESNRSHTKAYIYEVECI